MTDQLSSTVSIVFLGTTLASIILYYFANGKALKSSLIIVVWSIIHSILAQQGFYKNTTSIPPRFLLVFLPSILFIIYGLQSTSLFDVSKKRNTTLAAFLHTIRLPMELCLFGLFSQELIPEVMTYEGWNFDIVMGISAPIIAYLTFRKKITNQWLLVWNCIGLILIFCIFFIGIFSAELPFQLFGFNQPNIAVTLFPFILLPATVVPIVIYMHASEIFRLLKNDKERP